MSLARCAGQAHRCSSECMPAAAPLMAHSVHGSADTHISSQAGSAASDAAAPLVTEFTDISFSKPCIHCPTHGSFWKSCILFVTEKAMACCTEPNLCHHVHTAQLYKQAMSACCTRVRGINTGKRHNKSYMHGSTSQGASQLTKKCSIARHTVVITQLKRGQQ